MFRRFSDDDTLSRGRFSAPPNAFLQPALGPQYRIKPIYDPIRPDKFQKTYESRTGCVFGVGRMQEP